jgi:hypothetical protein
MNIVMMDYLFNEGVKLHKEECCVCYERFIDISCDKLFDLYEKLVEEKNYVISDDDIAWGTLSYDDRFECLTCKNKVCYGCIMKMPDPDEKYPDLSGDYDNMEETGRITCPVCKTKDFRLKIQGHLKGGYCGARGGLFPEELLYDIKTNLKK